MNVYISGRVILIGIYEIEPSLLQGHKSDHQ